MVVKKTALLKDIFRDIRKSLGRFISIAAIIALGVAFFSGLKIAPADMKGTADKYYDEYNLMDIRILSNLGLTGEDLEEINEIQGVNNVFGTFTLDALAEYKEKEVVLRVHGFSLENEINGVDLIEGRMPEASNEAIIEKGKNNFLDIPIGSTIKLFSGKDEPLSDDLKNIEYKVVGKVQTPYYLSFEKGNTNIGNGQVRSFIMIPQENFKSKVYTDIFVTVEGAKELNSYKDEYFQVVDSVTDSIKDLGIDRANIRYSQVANEAMEELEKGKREYFEEKQEAEEKLSKALKEIEDAKLEIIDGERKLEAEEIKFKRTIKDGKSRITEAENELIKAQENLFMPVELIIASRQKLEEEKAALIKAEKEGQAKFKKAREDIEKAKIDLAQGEEEYKTNKDKADKEFAEAWEKIEDAKKEISKIPKGKWYVLDRKSHYSYVDYGGAADRIDALSKVFPLFFALVAALVCLTTMTRMVDEQRVNIGTLKALGYGKGAIASKYIFYALAATLLGCIVGIGVGYTLFPTVIFNAYGIMYILPPIVLKFDILLATSISLGATGLTTITAFIASSNELRESPAALMRPRAPKMGKRILLERIPFIWNRFNFSAKVTTRNIFRYKRRFFMTVFGIAGCTALMLTAFGIKDSIRTVVERQYGVLFNYDMTVGLERESVKYLDENKEIDNYELIHRESGSVSLNQFKKDTAIIVPKDIKNIDDLINLQNRKDESKIIFPEKGVVISEQLGKSLDVNIGDEINLTNNESEEFKVKVVGITENYTLNYVYLSPGYYNDIFDKNIEFNEAIAKLKDTSKELEDNLSKELIRKDGITSVSFNRAIKEDFENTIRSLNYVVLVMIVSAGALAFVVLYNLTNVNISERIREIATIKVLGFYDGEVSAYIYRENIILTFIGTIVGIVMGIFLHRYIMTTVEMDNIMFGLELNPKSYIISVALTLIFSIFVNLAMYYKLKNVQMVESLKSVD